MSLKIYKKNNLFYLNGALVPVNTYRCLIENISGVDYISINNIPQKTHVITRIPVTAIEKEAGSYANLAGFISDVGTLFSFVPADNITGYATETKQDTQTAILNGIINYLESINNNTNTTYENQTSGTQKSQIVDGSENVLTLYDRSLTPTGKVINVQIGQGDIIGNIPVFIDYDHHQLHEGEMFRWSVYIASLGINANKDIRFVVPNITIPEGINPVKLCPHFRFEFVCSGDAVITLYESSTFTGNGTQRTPIPLERNGVYVSKLQVWEDPTVNALGNIIWQGLTTAGKSAGGEIANSSNEFVLKNNTQYFFRLTSLTASNKVLMRYEWHEDLGV